jgi:hypothetical protein
MESTTTVLKIRLLCGDVIVVDFPVEGKFENLLKFIKRQGSKEDLKHKDVYEKNGFTLGMVYPKNIFEVEEYGGKTLSEMGLLKESLYVVNKVNNNNNSNNVTQEAESDIKKSKKNAVHEAVLYSSVLDPLKLSQESAEDKERIRKILAEAEANEKKKELLDKRKALLETRIKVEEDRQRRIDKL